MLNNDRLKGMDHGGGNGNHPSAPIPERPQSRLRPTLFIGLGGTGYRIAVYLKALFARRREGLPDWFRILVLDTADESVVARLGDGQTVRLEPGSEFVHIGHVPVGRIVRHREKHSAIVERFGESLNQLPPTVLRHGAKQVRLLGLLALYWHFHEIEKRLQQTVWHLANRETDRRTVVEGERGMNIVIASSLGGGTGAGTFLDVGYLTRTLVEELGDLGDFCQITGVGVLPGAFPNVDAPYMEANTVASLIELNHAMTHHDFQAVYPNGRVIEPMAPPFNLYYVIDGVDERGRVWSGIDAVCRQAARALYLQIGSQLGRKGENDFDNLDEVLSGITPDGIGTFLGSVGLSICQFDAVAAHLTCARRQALSLIREGWQRSHEPESLEDAASVEGAAFWEEERLETEWLMDDLAIDEAGVPISVNLVPPARLRQLSLQQKAEETVAYIDAYRSARLEGSFQAAIDVRRKERSASAEDHLRQTVIRRVEDPLSGVETATALLADVDHRLDAAREKLQIRYEECESAIVQLDREQKRRASILLQAPTKGLWGRRGSVRAAQRRYLETATEAYRQRLTQSLCGAALRVLDDLSQVRADLQVDVDQLIIRLRGAAQLLLTAPKHAGARTAVDLELAEPAYVSKLYDHYALSLRDAAGFCIDGNGSLLEWAERPAGELARWLEQRTAKLFQAVRDQDVETVLRERSDQVSTEARRLWLLERATPSWNLDRSRMADGGAGLVSVTVLGVPDVQETVFAEQSEALVSTEDEQRIIALRATVGAPYTALQRYPAWERAYQAKRGSRPLHVLPTFHTSQETALQAFAVGLVFQLIFSQGSWYYYQPADRLDEPQRLAQGLHKAMRAFASREGLAREVLDRVDQYISVRLTTAEAIEKLDAYCRAGEHGETIDELDRRLRKAARAYAERLRKMLAASEGIADLVG